MNLQKQKLETSREQQRRAEELSAGRKLKKIKISRCVRMPCVCGYKTKHKKREILPLQKIENNEKLSFLRTVSTST